jgi:predicted restriction endonuclease
MPFHPDTKRRIVRDRDGKHKPCAMCGRSFPPPDAAHIINSKEWKKKKLMDSQVNGMPLCKTCHTVFDDYLRPKLYKALKEFGVKRLPQSWKNSLKRQIKDES